MNNEIESLVNNGTAWFPEGVSTVSADVDILFYVIFYGSIVISLIMFFIGLFFLIKYKRNSSNLKAEKHVIHSTKLEIIWTVIPVIIVSFIFYFGYKGYLSMVIPPQNAIQINVTAKKWAWEFEYPDTGVRVDKEFVIPVNTPVKLVMTSQDVIHSFYLPNFRMKKDVVPNRYTKLWFQATREGVFQVFCTEYCGDGHSAMLGSVRVVSEAEYEKWASAGDPDAELSLPELGEKLYTSKSCNVCHSTDGSPKTGPTWKGLFGSTRSFQNGSDQVADENYIIESIQDPAAKVVKGYAPIMPMFNTLSEREVNGIIEYIKTLK